jgi:hypothetical protein
VGLVITGGRAEAGGGIFSQNAALTLEGVVLSNNAADFQEERFLSRKVRSE